MYFRPPEPSASVFGSNQDLQPSPPSMPDDIYNAGTRFGLLFSNDSVALYIRRPSDALAPVLYGRVNLLPSSVSGSPLYLVFNLYGQTRGIRFISP